MSSLFFSLVKSLRSFAVSGRSVSGSVSFLIVFPFLDVYNYSGRFGHSVVQVLFGCSRFQFVELGFHVFFSFFESFFFCSFKSSVGFGCVNRF